MPSHELRHTPCQTPGPSAAGFSVRESLARFCFGITVEAFDRFQAAGFGPHCTMRDGEVIATDAKIDQWFDRGWKIGEKEMLAELQHTHPA